MRTTLLTLSALALAVVAAPAALAQSEGPAARGKATAESPAAEALALAAELAAYGRATDSPAALIAAASILADNPATVGEFDSEGATTAVSLDANELLDEAAALGGDFADAIATVRRAAQAGTASRGATGGAIYVYRDVAPNSTREFTIMFDGGEDAHLQINGDGDTDVDYDLYDQNGNLVGWDYAYHDDAHWDWYVSRGQTYTLVARNLGSRTNTILITTN